MKATIVFEGEPGDREDLANISGRGMVIEGVDRAMISFIDNKPGVYSEDPGVLFSAMVHGNEGHWSEP